MKYSFVIPAYKDVYLKETIDSILAQTVDDLELIVVDDCSPCDINAVVASFPDKRIRYYKNERNIGRDDLVGSWNHAMQHATGEFVIVASDDDTYAADFLEQADELLAAHPDCDIIRGRVARMTDDGRVMDVECRFDECQQQESFVYHLFRHSYKCSANYIYRRTKFLDAGGFVGFPCAWYTDVATPLMMSGHGVLNMQRVSFFFRTSAIHISADISMPLLLMKLSAVMAFDKWQQSFFRQLPQSQLILQSMAAARLDMVQVIKGHVQHVPLWHLGIWRKYIFNNTFFFGYEKAEAVASRLISLFR